MKTVIYYFSGTGNSLAIAKGLAEALEGMVELLSIKGCKEEQGVEIDADLLGLVFPVYFLSTPDIVRAFVRKLVFKSDPYIFAVATCNGGPGHCLYSLKRMLKLKGKSLAAGFTIDMPGNAIIGKVDLTNPPEVQKERLIQAKVKLSKVVEAITERRLEVIEGKKTLRTNIQGILMSIFVKHLYRPTKRFYAESNCNHCGICVKVCPLKNIDFDLRKRPIWGNHCEICLACFHWCPEQVINMGKYTIGKKRFHHPEITIEEMMVR